MRGLRSLLVLMSVALVILPAAPCVLFSACPALVRAEPTAPIHSCCDRHKAEPPHATSGPVAPCKMACCQAKTVPPLVKKTAAPDVSATVATLSPQPIPTFVAGVVLPSVAPPASRSLQILHCLWRC